MRVSSGFAFGKRIVAQGSKVLCSGLKHSEVQTSGCDSADLDAGCILTFEPLNAEPLILKLTETIVETLTVDQLGMGTGFDDTTPVQDDDPVGMAYRG